MKFRLFVCSFVVWERCRVAAGFDIVDHLTHTQMDKKWNSIHGKTFFENANVPRLIKVELPKKSRLSFGR